MTDNLVKEKLSARAQRGSKPRCHRITQGTRDVVADRLTALIHDWGIVSKSDTWMPLGFLRILPKQNCININSLVALI